MKLEPPRPLTHPGERSRWGNAAIVLTLDATRPFHDAMEVPVEKAFFVTDLRRIVETSRVETARNPAPPLAERWLAALVASHGQDASERFARWMRETFTAQSFDEPQWGTWEAVLVQWAYEREPLHVLSSIERFDAFRASYLTTLDDRALDASLDAARGAKAEGWDLEMFTRHRTYDDDGIDPFLFVGFTVLRARFRRFVRHENATLTPREQEQLQAAAEQVARRLGLSRARPLLRLEELLEPGG